MADLIVVLVLTATLFLVAIAAMAIGVIMRRPCLRGSCGGPSIHAQGGTKISCATCPNRRRNAA